MPDLKASKGAVLITNGAFGHLRAGLGRHPAAGRPARPPVARSALLASFGRREAVAAMRQVKPVPKNKAGAGGKVLVGLALCDTVTLSVAANTLTTCRQI